MFLFKPPHPIHPPVQQRAYSCTGFYTVGRANNVQISYVTGFKKGLEIPIA
jgi:hypothetical protein